MADDNYKDDRYQSLFPNKGDTGDTGDTGLTGATGATGATGKSSGGKIPYILLSIGLVLGVYFTGQRSSHQLKQNINSLVEKSCLYERNPKSNTSKFNDLVNSILEVRTATRDQAKIDKNLAIKKGDKAAQKAAQSQIIINQQAINRYKKTLITPRTVEQCKEPLIK